MQDGKWSPREHCTGAGSFEWTNRNHTKVSVPSNRHDGSACIWFSYAGSSAGPGEMGQGSYNIIISGGTGSGKTTFLNALSQYIPSTDRVITIEDSAELQLQGIPNLVRLETRDSKGEGTTAITIRDLIRSSLRMRLTGSSLERSEAVKQLICFRHLTPGTMALLAPVMPILQQICSCVWRRWCLWEWSFR